MENEMMKPVPIMTICSDSPGIGIPGKWIHCIECMDRIYLSDSTIDAAMEKYEDVELSPYCLICGVKKLKESNIPMAQLTNKQKAEIERNINL